MHESQNDMKFTIFSQMGFGRSMFQAPDSKQTELETGGI